jgi:hypothetical protein
MSFLIQQLVANAGSGSPSTLGRIVAAKAIFDFITNDSISDVSVSGSPQISGAGYVVGETFDIVVAGSPGADIFTAVGVVTEIDGGGSPTLSPVGQVTGVKIVSGGAYQNAVQSPEIQTTGLSTANASAGGDDNLLVDVVFEEAHWTEDRGFGAESPNVSTDYADDSTDFEWICTSLKASNPPTIGMKTGQATGNGYARLLVATGFDKGALWDGQQGRNPINGAGESRIMISGQNPQIYVSSTERRVNVLIRDGSFSHYGILGLFIPYTNTEANYPFPGIVAGTSTGAVAFNSIRADNSATPSSVASGIVNAMQLQNTTYLGCPYWYRDNLSTAWNTICDTTAEQSNLIAQMWPNESNLAAYDFTHAPQVDGFSTDPNAAAASTRAGVFADRSGTGWFQSAEGGTLGVPGIAPLGLQNRASIVVQPHIMKNQSADVQAIGILDGIEAVHGRGLTSFEEIVQFNGKRYIVFNDVNSGDLWRWVAMEIV